MAVAFQVVVSRLGVLSGRFGETRVLAAAALLGLTDMDALTFGMNRLAETPVLILMAARALALGVTVNSAFKTGLAIAFGSSRYRSVVVPGLLVLMAAGAVGFWLVKGLNSPI